MRLSHGTTFILLWKIGTLGVVTVVIYTFGISITTDTVHGIAYVCYHLAVGDPK